MQQITGTLDFTEENVKKLLSFFKEEQIQISADKPEVKPVFAAPQTPQPDPIKSSETGAASTAKTAGTPSQESASEKKVTREEVRAAALTLNKAGRKDIVAAVFKEFGGKKFSDFDERPEVYPEMMKKFQEASNA